MSTSVAFLEEWRDLMRGRGHTVLETAGWRTRDAEPGRGYDPTRMFLEHHDASTVLAGNWGALGYVTANKLAQLVFSRDGKAMIVAAGITWHAGVGGPFADIPANQGNWYSLAVEVANSGSEAYAPELTRLIVDAEACWCIAAERGADRVRGHKEWARPVGRKRDPSIDMNARRAAVAAAIKSPAKPAGTPAPAQEDEMQYRFITQSPNSAWFAWDGRDRFFVDGTWKQMLIDCGLAYRDVKVIPPAIMAKIPVRLSTSGPSAADIAEEIVAKLPAGTLTASEIAEEVVALEATRLSGA